MILIFLLVSQIRLYVNDEYIGSTNEPVTLEDRHFEIRIANIIPDEIFKNGFEL